MIENLIANYTAEQVHFQKLVENDTESNILLFRGESGSGKSYLIEHCLTNLKGVPSVLLKLQNGGETIPTLFTRLGQKCGWQNLPHFTNTVANLLEQPDKANHRPWLMGMHRHLGEVSKIGDLESRRDRYRYLTDAWFADTLQFETPFILAVDGYEQASTLFTNWFSEDFLQGVANSGRTRVLVGGKKVPDIEDVGWSLCASLHELKGIHEAEEWLVWAEKAGYQIPSLELMAGVVIALKGKPNEIVQTIKSEFPLQKGPIHTKQTVRKQRKRIRRNIIELFTLSELKDICYDMEIDYEKLSDQDRKSGFVREMLAHIERIGRFNELIQICQAERPQLEW